MLFLPPLADLGEEILPRVTNVAAFREEDVRAGRPVSDKVRLQITISRLREESSSR
jgi:hypothetical protein